MSRPKLNMDSLRSLLNEDLIRSQASERPSRPYVLLPINVIEPDPLQPRQSFSPDSIEELAANIRQNGLINPLTVRVKEGRYSLVCGERRHRACKVAGMAEVPCVVREITDSEAMFLALTENILREDLNDMDRSRYLLRLKKELELTWPQVADALGLSEARVKQLAGLAALPEPLQQSVQEGKVAGSTAQRIAAIQDDAVREELMGLASQGAITRQEVIQRTSNLLGSYRGRRPAEPLPEVDEEGQIQPLPAREVPAVRRMTVTQRFFEFRRLLISLERLNEEEREEAEIIREQLDRLLGK